MEKIESIKLWFPFFYYFVKFSHWFRLIFRFTHFVFAAVVGFYVTTTPPCIKSTVSFNSICAAADFPFYSLSYLSQLFSPLNSLFSTLSLSYRSLSTLSHFLFLFALSFLLILSKTWLNFNSFLINFNTLFLLPLLPSPFLFQ